MKIIFEYDGLYFHNDTNAESDRIKEELAVAHGYRVIRLKGMPQDGSARLVFEENCVTIKEALGEIADDVTWNFKRKFYFDKTQWENCRANLQNSI